MLYNRFPRGRAGEGTAPKKTPKDEAPEKTKGPHRSNRLLTERSLCTLKMASANRGAMDS